MKKKIAMLACAVLVVASLFIILPEESDADATMSSDDLQIKLDTSSVVEMTGNVVLQKGHHLVINSDIILDMNGMSITVASDFEGKPLINYGKLTITGDGTIDSSASDKADGAILNYGDLTIEDGTYKGHYLVLDHNNEFGLNDGTTVLNMDGAKVTINGGTFVGSTCALLNFSEAVVNGGEFTSKSCNTCDGSNSTYTVRNQSRDSRMVVNGGYVEGVQGALSAAIGYLEVNGGTFKSVKCFTNPTHGSYHACYAAGEYGNVQAHINGGLFIAESTGGWALCIGNDTIGDGGIRDPASGFITGGEFRSNNSLLNVAANTGSVEITGGCYDREITNTLMPGYSLVEKDAKWYVTTPAEVDESGKVTSETSSAYSDLSGHTSVVVDLKGATIDLRGDSDLGILNVSVNPQRFAAAPDAISSYEISIVCDAGYTADITVDASIPSGHKALVYYIDGSNELVSVQVVDYTSSTVTFRTTHNTPFIIMSEAIEETPTTPPSSGGEDEEYPFLPGHGSNQGSTTTVTKDSSNDTTKIIAAAAAVVVIMLAAVALMVNRNN